MGATRVRIGLIREASKQANLQYGRPRPSDMWKEGMIRGLAGEAAEGRESLAAGSMTLIGSHSLGAARKFALNENGSWQSLDP